MGIKKQFIHATFAFSLIASVIQIPLHASDTQSAEQIASCDCPKATCNIKAIRCIWHILKASLAIPATLLTLSHFNEACSLLFSEYQQGKAVYQFINTAATGYFIYAVLKDSYEGLKEELSENSSEKTRGAI